MPRKIIIDTDPGQDDAVAILFALGSPELEVMALTTLAGNVPLEMTQRNARIVLEIAGRSDIPVYAGRWSPPSMCMARPGWTGSIFSSRQPPWRRAMPWMR